MKFYFEGAFYDSEINSEIPEGAVELTDEKHCSLLEAQSSGKVITTDESGAPITADPPPPSAEALARDAAAELYATIQHRTVMQAVSLDDDATAFALAPICPQWQPNTHYEAGEIVNHVGQSYRVIQPIDTIEHQMPGSEGMLTVYRPLNLGHAGTADDPIPFVSGMDVDKGKYYNFSGKTYLAKADMKPCIWKPGSDGLWQWELVEA
ncbi:carbohydrate-binding protein [uncultured Victivallis sp.]|uniref:carbohydrate-binding protein n=1 Tax=uncultured Victivallis sp. TaxID=354118 RepID=UPI00258D65C5|nr:carbohydrate-binding protein [uncultured Victivallis sp.]